MPASRKLSSDLQSGGKAVSIVRQSMVDAGQPPGQELHINSEKPEQSASLPVYSPLLSNIPRSTYVTSTTEVPFVADSNGDVEHPLIPAAESSHFVISTLPWLFRKPKRHLIIFVIQTITEIIISSVPIIVIIHPEDIGWVLLFFSHLIWCVSLFFLLRMLN